MNSDYPTPFRIVFRNTLISMAVLFCASLAFVFIITLFPLIGSLTMDHFPMRQVIRENFTLLPPLLAVSLLISPWLGWCSYRFLKKRFLKLLLLGLAGNWLAIAVVMLLWTGLQLSTDDIFNMLLLSFWALLAYSLYSIPVMVPAFLLIERWTRRKA
jgi:hypothetical protein